MKKIIAKVLVVGALMSTTTALAATDGTVGATSTGTANITLTIPKLIKLVGLADFAFGTYTGTGDFNGNENVVVSTNYGTAARTYRIRATGSGASSAFTLTDGSQTIPYAVYWNDATGTSGRVALTTNINLTAQGGASKPLSSSSDNANYSVEILEANMQSVDAGAFSGTLTLVVTPE
ncbi:hypothetical protein JNK13_01290 [bacterium]|nr:hypothetical protein [bacterium]